MSKTILITGATAGFGEATARKFAGGGWKVIGTGRRGDRLKTLQQELGDVFLPLELDMRDRAGLEKLAELSPPWGEIDLLLNNAGLAPPTDPLPDTDWTRVEEVIDINITGLVALTRALLPGLVKRKGQIINLSSVAGTYPYKGGAVYGGTKAFVRQFSLDRVGRIVKLGVFVNSAPGFTEQSKVANGASELMQEVFGEAGRHARSAVGVAVLPLGVAVEVDAIVAVKA
jgi:serine 3-dehydrogenase